MKFERASKFFAWIHGGKKDTLECTETELVKTSYHVFKPKERVISVNLADISFLDYTCGIFSKKFSAGYINSITFKSLTKENCKKIADYIESKDPKISINTDSLEKYYTTKKEFVCLSDKAILHRIQTKKRARISYIPYDKIDFALFAKSSWFKKSLVVSGELNFCTEHSFPSSVAKKIEANLKKYISISNGKVFHPCLFSGVKQRSRISLICMSDKIVYTDTRTSIKEQLTGGASTTMAVFNKITSYKCKPIFSLFKRIAYIEGLGHTDLRTKETTSYKITFPGVFFFTWGSIKSYLKKLK